MNFTRSEVARVTEGVLQGPDGIIRGLTIDSRAVKSDELFVAIHGDRDGHEFVSSARESGATTFLVDRTLGIDGEIVVSDTEVALRALGAHARSRISGPVVGVTGSAGKTSTKDLLAGIFRVAGPTTASLKSFNNELGVPLTLANGPEHAEFAVIEMGARGVGHIAVLCEIAQPTIGVITNIGTAHRELFLTAEMTARAKGELLQSLPTTGTAVLNADDPMLDLLRSLSRASVLTFSAAGSTQADLWASDVVLDETLRAAFTLNAPSGSIAVTLSVRGRHQVANALAAAGAAIAGGVSLETVALGLQTEDVSPWRMEVSTLATGALVCNDAYNANPTAMLVALSALSEFSAERRIAVLGTMAELGDDAAAMHRQVRDEATRLGIDVLVSVNESRYPGSVEVRDFVSAVDWLVTNGAVGEGTAILVKGSRIAGLERLVDLLHQRTGPALELSERTTVEPSDDPARIDLSSSNPASSNPASSNPASSNNDLSFGSGGSTLVGVGESGSIQDHSGPKESR
jgi:UDP-N-acetylmuramoyl-tripeptide--D-alanyl-D-alanine ligase